MPSTYSPLLRLELMQTGEKSATWGDITNTNLGMLLEKGIAGSATVDVSVGNVTLSALNGADDQARCLILRVVGNPGVTRSVVAPSASKAYAVLNSSNAPIVLKGAATVGLTLAAGDRAWVAWDGSDFVRISIAADSPTITGTPILSNVSVPGVASINTLVVSGATTLGDAAGDTVAVNAANVAWANNPAHTGNHTFNGTVTFSSTLAANGDIVLGNAPTDTLTVAPNAVTWSGDPTHSGNHAFSGNVAANGNVALGNASTDTLTIAPSAVTWSNDPTHSGNHTFSGNVTANGNNVLGNASTDTLTIAPNAVTWSNDPTHSGNHTFSGNVTANGNTVLGNASTDTLNVGVNGIVKGADGRTAFGATSVAALGSGTDQVGVAGTLGLSGAQINVNPATDFEMVHRGTGGWWFYTDNAGKVPFKVDRLAATNTLQLTSAGVAVGGDGRLYGLSLHNNPGAVTGTTNQYIASGTYTPTLTSVLNVSASTAFTCQWMRVGNVVSVSGKLDMDPTSAGATELGISLPIASGLTALQQAGGTAVAISGGQAGFVYADPANDRVSLGVSSLLSSANDSWFFSFMYLIA